MRNKPWKCPECNSEWPASTSVAAYKQHKQANEVHPDQYCYEIVNDYEVTGIDIAPTRTLVLGGYLEQS